MNWKRFKETMDIVDKYAEDSTPVHAEHDVFMTGVDWDDLDDEDAERLDDMLGVFEDEYGNVACFT